MCSDFLYLFVRLLNGLVDVDIRRCLNLAELLNSNHRPQLQGSPGLALENALGVPAPAHVQGTKEEQSASAASEKICHTSEQLTSEQGLKG